MSFMMGFLCGAAAVAAVGLARRGMRRGVAKPGVGLRRGCAQIRAENRNFLRYDGTEMPVSKQRKEVTYGKSK